MKTYNIPVIWSMWGLIPVEAESLEEAIAKAAEPDTNLPATSEYLDGSFIVEDLAESLELHNNTLTAKDKKFLKKKG